MGSIPVRVTRKRKRHSNECLFFFCAPHTHEPSAHTILASFLAFLKFILCQAHISIPVRLGSNTAFGGILRYSSCRPTNSRFPYAFAAWVLTLFSLNGLQKSFRISPSWQYTASSGMHLKYQKLTDQINLKNLNPAQQIPVL